MLPQMEPYTPSLYQPDSYGRYRIYPREVQTPIPGAGYDVRQMVWAEQELNLDGSSKPQNYGSYSQVPLRGLGLELSTPTLTTMALPQPTLTPTEPAPQPPPDAPAPAPLLEPQGFFQRRVGPVPVWALGAGGSRLRVVWPGGCYGGGSGELLGLLAKARRPMQGVR